MFRNYITVAFRNLINNKLYSSINIIGLAVGLAACVMIALFVRDEFSYDQQWQKAGEIHRLHTTFNNPGREPLVTVVAQGPAKQALKNYFSEDIEFATRFNVRDTVVGYGGNVFNEEIVWTDPDTVDMFNFTVVAGDVRAALNDNASLVINESFARKYFGEEAALGKILTVDVFDLQRDYRIGAVIKDLPHNTVLSFQALAMIDEKDFVNQSWMFDSWFSVSNYLYFQLKDGGGIAIIDNAISAFTDASIDVGTGPDGEPAQASSFIAHTTQPLIDIQLQPRAGARSEMKPTGSIAVVYIFAAIASFILLIACINFMNLATAKSTQRAREVAIRKVHGAQRFQLAAQFLGETIMVAIVGLLLGLVLVEISLPLFSEFVGKSLVFDYTDAPTIAALIGLVVVVGVIGGAYPALVLSGFLPAKVLGANRSAEIGGSAGLRNILVVSQFAISISLIVATSVVFGQKLYATNLDTGFNKDNLLVVRGVSRTGAQDKQDALRAEILRLPGVTNVSYSADAPSSGNENNQSVTVPGDESGGTILIGVQAVDYDFFETYQIPFVAGRAYDRVYASDVLPTPETATAGVNQQGSLIVNEGALRRFGFGSPEQSIGKTVELYIGANEAGPIRADMTIVGVVPDMPFTSIRSAARPEMYVMYPAGFDNLTVRFEGDGAVMAERIEGVWKSLITTVPYTYEYVDALLAAEFEGESNQSILLAIFAGLAVSIACLGLYGLAAFTAERRTKEIGVRKVLGATVMDIVRLLVWQFSKPVLMANLIAWPLVTYAMLRWLETFTYRLDAWLLGPLCLAAGLTALFIAWATVGGNAASVARTNPIKALRYE
ncbi:MAG: ABC transporter permease [Kordiimonadales bacterium]|nr:MAG: ABC transporter permease [Kordiimonadales bacterium]